MRDYMYPNGGNGGSFNSTDAPDPKVAPQRKKGNEHTKWERVKRNGRRIDRAGKLVHQTARPDLKTTDYVDPKRTPGFKNI